jgi:hypothetical protein
MELLARIKETPDGKGRLWNRQAFPGVREELQYAELLASNIEWEKLKYYLENDRLIVYEIDSGLHLRLVYAEVNELRAAIKEEKESDEIVRITDKCIRNGEMFIESQKSIIAVVAEVTRDLFGEIKQDLSER